MLDPTYFRYLYDQFADGTLDPSNESALPKGVTDIYDKQINSIQPFYKRQEVLVLLGVFACAQGPVSKDLVSELNSILNKTSSQKDLDKFLSQFSSWFNTDNDGLYYFAHERIRAFVLQKIGYNDLLNIDIAFVKILNNTLDDLLINTEEILLDNSILLYFLQTFSKHYARICLNDRSYVNEYYTLVQYSKIHEVQFLIERNYHLAMDSISLAIKTFNSIGKISYNIDLVILIGELHIKQENNTQQLYENYLNKQTFHFSSFLSAIETQNYDKKFNSYLLILNELLFLNQHESNKKLIEKTLNHLSANLPNSPDVFSWNETVNVNQILFLLKELWRLGYNLDGILSNGYIYNYNWLSDFEDQEIFNFSFFDITSSIDKELLFHIIDNISNKNAKRFLYLILGLYFVHYKYIDKAIELIRNKDIFSSKDRNTSILFTAIFNHLVDVKKLEVAKSLVLEFRSTLAGQNYNTALAVLIIQYSNIDKTDDIYELIESIEDPFERDCVIDSVKKQIGNIKYKSRLLNDMCSEKYMENIVYSDFDIYSNFDREENEIKDLFSSYIKPIINRNNKVYYDEFKENISSLLLTSNSSNFQYLKNSSLDEFDNYLYSYVEEKIKRKTVKNALKIIESISNKAKAIELYIKILKIYQRENSGMFEKIFNKASNIAEDINDAELKILKKIDLLQIIISNGDKQNSLNYLYTVIRLVENYSVEFMDIDLLIKLYPFYDKLGAPGKEKIILQCNQIIEEYSDWEFKSRNLLTISRSLANEGSNFVAESYINNAFIGVSKEETRGIKSELLYNCILSYIENGSLMKAIDNVQAINDPSYITWALSEISKKYYSSNDYENGHKFLLESEDQLLRIRVKDKGAFRDSYLKIGTLYFEYVCKSKGIAYIVKALNQAKSQVSLFDSHLPILSIGKWLNENGQLELALSLIDKIELKSERIKYIGNIINYSNYKDLLNLSYFLKKNKLESKLFYQLGIAFALNIINKNPNKLIENILIFLPLFSKDKEFISESMFLLLVNYIFKGSEDENYLNRLLVIVNIEEWKEIANKLKKSLNA